MKYIIDIGRQIYNLSDFLLNAQPYRNQEVEIAIFTLIFIAETITLPFLLFSNIALFVICAGLMSVTLWVLVTMFYALDQMDKFKSLEGNEDKELDNCATNLCVVVRCARHSDLECKTTEK